MDNREALKVSKKGGGMIGVVETCKVLTAEQVFNKH